MHGRGCCDSVREEGKQKKGNREEGTPLRAWTGVVFVFLASMGGMYPPFSLSL